MPNDLTVAEYLKQWLDTYGRENLAKTTLEVYKINIETHVIPKIGHIKLQELKPLQLNQFLSHLSFEGRKDGKGGLSKATVLKIYRILSRAFNHAVKLQLLEKNPLQYVEAPNQPGSPAEALKIKNGTGKTVA